LASNTAAPFQLREFQLELAENAVLGRNTIICAETGSGKTWVALHIVQQHLQNARNGKKMILVMFSLLLLNDFLSYLVVSFHFLSNSLGTYLTFFMPQKNSIIKLN
jgi:ATP-dependent helicase YprA (DUF1998 family)